MAPDAAGVVVVGTRGAVVCAAEACSTPASDSATSSAATTTTIGRMRTHSGRRRREVERGWTAPAPMPRYGGLGLPAGFGGVLDVAAEAPAGPVAPRRGRGQARTLALVLRPLLAEVGGGLLVGVEVDLAGGESGRATWSRPARRGRRCPPAGRRPRRRARALAMSRPAPPDSAASRILLRRRRRSRGGRLGDPGHGDDLRVVGPVGPGSAPGGSTLASGPGGSPSPGAGAAVGVHRRPRRGCRGGRGCSSPRVVPERGGRRRGSRRLASSTASGAAVVPRLVRPPAVSARTISARGVRIRRRLGRVAVGGLGRAEAPLRRLAGAAPLQVTAEAQAVGVGQGALGARGQQLGHERAGLRPAPAGSELACDAGQSRARRVARRLRGEWPTAAGRRGRRRRCRACRSRRRGSGRSPRRRRRPPRRGPRRARSRPAPPRRAARTAPRRWRGRRRGCRPG